MLERVIRELAQRIEAMIADGKDNHVYFKIACGFRPLADQQRLYNLYKADPKHNAIAAVPGTSNHGKLIGGAQQDATAVDLDVIPQTPANIQKHLELATKWGLYRAVKGEYWHLELAKDRQPLKQQEDELDMQIGKYIHGCKTPSGKARWMLQPSGAVDTLNFDDKVPAPSHGSMYDYPDEREKHMPYVSIEPLGDHDEDGYMVIGTDGFAGKFKKS